MGNHLLLLSTWSVHCSANLQKVWGATLWCFHLKVVSYNQLVPYTIHFLLSKSFPFGLGIAKTTLALVCISYEHVADGGCLIQNPYNSITQLAIHSKPDHNCTTHNTILQMRMTRPEELIFLPPKYLQLIPILVCSGLLLVCGGLLLVADTRLV